MQAVALKRPKNLTVSQMEAGQTVTVTGISDVSTGLYNYGFRDYKPTVARFTTVDPIRDGSNWFAYVNNDPVNYIDLWGLCADRPGIKIPDVGAVTARISENVVLTFDQSVNRNDILAEINALSRTQYAMDKDGYLYATDTTKNGGSITYSQIIDSIISNNERTVIVGISDMAFVGSIPVNINDRYGGGVTLANPDPNNSRRLDANSNLPVVVITTSNNSPYTTPTGTADATPGQKIMHELVTHVTPLVVDKTPSVFDSVTRENIIRGELGLPDMNPGPTHSP